MGKAITMENQKARRGQLTVGGSTPAAQTLPVSRSVKLESLASSLPTFATACRWMTEYGHRRLGYSHLSWRSCRCGRPRATKNMTLLPLAWGEKNSVTSSSKKFNPEAPNRCA